MITHTLHLLIFLPIILELKKCTGLKFSSSFHQIIILKYLVVFEEKAPLKVC